MSYTLRKGQPNGIVNYISIKLSKKKARWQMLDTYYCPMNLKCIYLSSSLFHRRKNLRIGKEQLIAKSRTASRAVERGLKLRLLTPRAVRCPPRCAASHQDDELTSDCRIVPVEKIALPGQRITD